MRKNLLQLAPDYGLEMQPTGTYMAFNGPRLETAAEIRMYQQLGGDVVSMTGAPEAFLARELCMHFAAVATSINYAAGMKKGQTHMDTSGLKAQLGAILKLFINTMGEPHEVDCDCDNAVRVSHEPTAWEWRGANS
jgi:purine nucleoside phosphorylase